MAILEILEFPDVRLRTQARRVGTVDQRIRKLVDDMFETMYEAPGIGLAASQVNVHEQVIVIDTTHTRTTDGGCWWEVAIPEVSVRPEVNAAHANHVAAQSGQRL